MKATAVAEPQFTESQDAIPGDASMAVKKKTKASSAAASSHRTCKGGTLLHIIGFLLASQPDCISEKQVVLEEDKNT